MAYLTAHEATHDPYYLDAARETALALVRGQLRSGGWHDRIEFNPTDRAGYSYRVDPDRRGARNVTTLDDDKTQSAVRLLMGVDRAQGFKDPTIHEATRYSLDRLTAAQYPNGAWPQRFSAPPDPKEFPVKRADYPESWPRNHPEGDYGGYYTLNDNTQADTVDVMLEAARVYAEPRYRAAALRGGDFVLLAQMPDPQPAWAQQYGTEMHPAWARKFEPPAVTGGESHGAMRILLHVYRETGDAKYLEPIPRALAYLRRSRLPDGRLARFYGLWSNWPRFFTKDYRLTYDSSDMPTHYAFKVGDQTDSVAREYEHLRAGGSAKPDSPPRRPGRPPEGRVRAVIAALDERGRWVEEGRLRTHGDADPTRRVIDSRTFIRNVETLARYLDASRP